MILDRLSKMMGLHLTQHAVSRFMGTSEWNPDSPVELLDIVEIGERVKHTNVVANAEGFFFQYQAVHMEQSGYKVALLAQAMERFEGSFSFSVYSYYSYLFLFLFFHSPHQTEALSSSPNDVQGLLNCALTYYHYLVTNLRSQIEEGGNKEANMEEVYLSTRDLYVIKTDELFSRALLIEPVCFFFFFFFFFLFYSFSFFFSFFFSFLFDLFFIVRGFELLFWFTYLFDRKMYLVFVLMLSFWYDVVGLREQRNILFVVWN